MRSGTRKVSDSKPDTPATRKESDAIPMTFIGMFSVFCLVKRFLVDVLMNPIPCAIP